MEPWLTEAGQCLAPYLPQERFLIPAWLGCFRWALQDPDILAAFQAATGMHWQPGRTPIARMIDDATGMEQAFMVAFAAWMNATLWGEV